MKKEVGLGPSRGRSRDACCCRYEESVNKRQIGRALSAPHIGRRLTSVLRSAQALIGGRSDKRLSSCSVSRLSFAGVFQGVSLRTVSAPQLAALNKTPTPTVGSIEEHPSRDGRLNNGTRAPLDPRHDTVKVALRTYTHRLLS